MKRSEFGAPAVLAVFAFAALACGQPLTTAEQTQTAQAVGGTPGASVAADTATAVTATGTPTAATTPIAGLTDTGYKAPDGSPLYAECIQAQPPLPLPPQYPVPSGPITYPPIPSVLNPGPTPAPSDLPPFDPTSLITAPTAGWTTYASKCFGFSVTYPADWVLVSPFGPAGYQQGEDGVIASPDRSAKVEVHLRISDADELKLAMAAGGRPDVFILDGPTATTFKGRPAVVHYAYLAEPPAASVLVYTVGLGGSRYLTLSTRFISPYNLATAGDAITVLSNITLP